MAAKDHLNGEQLQMFIPARELAQYTSADAISDYDYAHDSYFDDGSEAQQIAFGPFNKTPLYSHKRADLHDPEYLANNWPRLATSSKNTTLAEVLDEEGIADPVDLLFDSDYDNKGPNQPAAVIQNGHHRVVYANEKDPNMEVPVTYQSTYPQDNPKIMRKV